jgi:hypothetical protein
MLYFDLITSTIIYSERRKLCQQNVQKIFILARDLLSNMCANIIESLKKVILSKEFLARHRNSPKAFTRQRKLPFHLLLCFLLNFVKGSYQDELDKFFQAINLFEVAKRVVSKVALTKARMKLKYEAFIELNDHLIRAFENTFEPRRWYNHRLIAIDGSTCQLPRIKEIMDHFGVWNVKPGKPCPIARISQLFDPLNKISISAVISPKSIDERTHAHQMLSYLMPSDLVLLDRGYPAFWLFKAIDTMGANFCARINSKWTIVKDFIASGQQEQILQMHASSSNITRCQQLELDHEPMTLRLIRIELNTGEAEVLITTLTDSKSYPIDIFAELYHQRWPVEEDYKYMKYWLEIGNITGKSVLSVYQDFYAKVFSKNLTSVLSFSTQSELIKSGKKDKYEHQINFVQALSKSKNVTALLFQRTRAKIIDLIKDLQEIFENTTEPIRPNRSFQRNHKVLKRKYYYGYKAFA